MSTTMPKLESPREACIAALMIVHCNGGLTEVVDLLQDAGLAVEIQRKPTSATARVRLSARRHYEATAGCASDAIAAALREALGEKIVAVA